MEVKLDPHDNKDSDSRSMLMHEQAAKVIKVDFERIEYSSKKVVRRIDRGVEMELLSDGRVRVVERTGRGRGRWGPVTGQQVRNGEGRNVEE
jgi:hypothetical protein